MYFAIYIYIYKRKSKWLNEGLLLEFVNTRRTSNQASPFKTDSSQKQANGSSSTMRESPLVARPFMVWATRRALDGCDKLIPFLSQRPHVCVCGCACVVLCRALLEVLVFCLGSQVPVWTQTLFALTPLPSAPEVKGHMDQPVVLVLPSVPTHNVNATPFCHSPSLPTALP